MDSAVKFGNLLYTMQQPVRQTAVDYFPLNVGLSGSVPDTLGTTFFNAQANFNLPDVFSNDTDANFSRASYTTNARAAYVTLQAGANRIQTIYKDWSVKLHADGQWADGAAVQQRTICHGRHGGCAWLSGWPGLWRHRLAFLH